MGCFSYLCQECKKSINSDSVRGEECRLYHLKNGVPVQELRGQYDSYGSVFNDVWNEKWEDMLDGVFDSNKANGIAAVHERCFKSIPKVQAKDAPNQGWGEIR